MADRPELSSLAIDELKAFADEYVVEQVINWVENGIAPNLWLTAVFENDLTRSVLMTPDEQIVIPLAKWVYKYTPYACRGESLLSWEAR